MSDKLAVKICGLRQAENCRRVGSLGVDYAGFIFFAASPRNAEGWVNKELITELKTHCEPVAVVVDSSMDTIQKLHEQLGFCTIQLHGDETPECCRKLKQSMSGLILLKAFRISDNFDFCATDAYQGLCSHFVFDAFTDAYGGSGNKFNWSLLADYKGETPFFLSGGISPDDASCIKDIAAGLPRFFGVDLNSKFETEPGLKSPALISRFLQEFRQ